MLLGIPAKSTERTVTFQETEIMEHVLRALSGWPVQQDAIERGDRELYEYVMYSFLVSDCQRCDRDADGGATACYSFYGFEKI